MPVREEALLLQRRLGVQLVHAVERDLNGRPSLAHRLPKLQVRALSVPVKVHLEKSLKFVSGAARP